MSHRTHSTASARTSAAETVQRVRDTRPLHPDYLGRHRADEHTPDGCRAARLLTAPVVAPAPRSLLGRLRGAR